MTPGLEGSEADSTCGLVKPVNRCDKFRGPKLQSVAEPTFAVFDRDVSMLKSPPQFQHILSDRLFGALVSSRQVNQWRRGIVW